MPAIRRSNCMILRAGHPLFLSASKRPISDIGCRDLVAPKRPVADPNCVAAHMSSVSGPARQARNQSTPDAERARRPPLPSDEVCRYFH